MGAVNSAAVDAPVRREALATGKGGRKTAHAKCAVFPNGSGKIVINDKEATDYFKNNLVAYMELYQLLYLLGMHTEHDFHFCVAGGGMTGQKEKGMLTRDARKKERKKYGLKKARKAPQFSKR